ncbi:MAG: hypothetical protein ABSH56_22500 [Bryobacteraceae bacterium]
MPPETIRTTIDIPAPLYRRLKEQAALQGCSVRDLVTRGIDRVLLKPDRPKRGRVVFPLIRSKGPKVSLTSKKLYELIEFP